MFRERDEILCNEVVKNLFLLYVYQISFSLWKIFHRQKNQNIYPGLLKITSIQHNKPYMIKSVQKTFPL